MVAFEKIAEAVEFANDEEVPWWSEFDSLTEAKNTLKEALKHNPDEWEVIRLAEALGFDDYPTNPTEVNITLNKCFATLKRQFRNTK